MVEPEISEGSRDWVTAVALAVSIVLLVCVFIWIVVRLEPVMGDFVPSGAPTATVTAGS
jgi:hypothetical protein